MQAKAEKGRTSSSKYCGPCLPCLAPSSRSRALASSSARSLARGESSASSSSSSEESLSTDISGSLPSESALSTCKSGTAGHHEIRF